jgi:hypothetical protein
LQEIVEDSGLEYVDVSVPFKGLDEKEYWILPIDGHPNAKAHTIFAEEIYKYLKHKIRE